MSAQVDLFSEAKLETPEPVAEIILGRHSVRFPLRRKRREALSRVMQILAMLEGKDVHISSYDVGVRYYWLHNLKLPKLRMEFYPSRYGEDPKYIPSVIVLWGTRSAQVRIFTDYLVAVREQEYQGYWHYLLDFCNGFWQSPIDNFRSHYACLHITRFKD